MSRPRTACLVHPERISAYAARGPLISWTTAQVRAEGDPGALRADSCNAHASLIGRLGQWLRGLRSRPACVSSFNVLSLQSITDRGSTGMTRFKAIDDYSTCVQQMRR